VTYCRLDDLGQTGVGQDIFFSAYPSVPALGHTEPPLQWVEVLVPRRKVARVWL